MKKYVMAALFLFVSIISRATEKIDAEKILTESDISRGGLTEGVSWNAVLSSVDDEEKTTREFQIKAKDHDAYVIALSPARNKGEVYLFNDRQMWFFKPSLKKPVSISARQKLSGQAANGDIASTHYARDYTATLEKTENINNEKVYVLMLKAKSNQMTYDQIRYWISDKTKLAMKAEFLTLQGKPFKEAQFEYNNNITYQGKKYSFISKMIISDSKFKDNTSTIEYQNPKPEIISNEIFKVNNLTR